MVHHYPVQRVTKSGIKFLVSTIEARIPVGIKQDINLNSPFPLPSKEVGHLVINPVVDISPS